MPNALTRDDLRAELVPLRAQLDGLPLMQRPVTVHQQEVRAIRSDIANIRVSLAALAARIEIIEKG